MIIGIVGFAGSGKDTLADYLVSQHNFRKLSFAGALKDTLSQIFGWDRELLEGRTAESRKWREQVDAWWSERLEIKNLTPRLMLQMFGTDVCRTHFHDSIWVASLENRLRKTTDNIVVTDCRFPNEILSVRNAGGKIVRIERGNDPVWIESAMSVNHGERGNITWALSKHRMHESGVHFSEWAWVGTPVDATIDNNDTINSLNQLTVNLVQGLLAPTQSLAA